MQANAKSSLFDCAKSMTPDNADTKEGNTTNNITTAKGMKDHNFALVYPILKNNGICIPVIVEETKNDKPNPSIISGTSKSFSTQHEAEIQNNNCNHTGEVIQKHKGISSKNNLIQTHANRTI